MSGDFFSADYLGAWLDVARVHPDVVFYGYTKSVPFWEEFAEAIPPNFRPTKSLGGKLDERGSIFKTARVVFSPEEADTLGLEIDHDDSHAFGTSQDDFALLIDGTQPKGSDAADAIADLKTRQIAFSYSTQSLCAAGLRRRIWWVGNDAIRRGEADRLPAEHRENLLSFLDLVSGGDPEERLMRVEVLRELGRFDEATELLRMEFPKTTPG